MQFERSYIFISYQIANYISEVCFVLQPSNVLLTLSNI